MRVLAASDKFKGTLTAAQACAAIGSACWDLGIECTEMPLADGGEGTLEIFGGPNRTTVVTGPLGDPVSAQWRLSGGTAVIEMARASGLALIGGAQNNDPVAATTRGTGELIDEALTLGAKRIIVCLGGSATTDGGLGAMRAIGTPARLKAVEFLVACDVDTHFIERFGGAILLTVLNAGVTAAVNAGTSGGSTVVLGWPGQLGQAVTGTARTQDIPATLRVPQGAAIQVFVARDLDFSTVVR